MRLFNKLSERIHYYLDHLNLSTLRVKIDELDTLKAKIDEFHFDSNLNQIIVIYRLGRQKLLQKMHIFKFKNELFEKVSNYDQHRLTKFSTFQYLLQDIFSSNFCSKDTLIKYIEKEMKNEQLF